MADERDHDVTYIGPRAFVVGFALVCCLFLAVAYGASKIAESLENQAQAATTTSEASATTPTSEAVAPTNGGAQPVLAATAQPIVASTKTPIATASNRLSVLPARTRPASSVKKRMPVKNAPIAKPTPTPILNGVALPGPGPMAPSELIAILNGSARSAPIAPTQRTMSATHKRLRAVAPAAAIRQAAVEIATPAPRPAARAKRTVAASPGEARVGASSTLPPKAKQFGRATAIFGAEPLRGGLLIPFKITSGLSASRALDSSRADRAALVIIPSPAATPAAATVPGAP